ncbi:MAG: dipeptidase [Armatimonadota bacterium]|nr:dipeptidase [Armatimonadota bacterium]MDR5696852.1 dipeptidase [Armatimonadota bacterium]
MASVLAALGMSGAGRLHRDALVVDLHADTLLHVADAGRRFGVRSRTGHVDLPRLREGGVDVQVFAVYVAPRYAPTGGHRRAIQLLDAFDREAGVSGRVVLCTTVEQIRTAAATGKLAAVLSIENGEAIGDRPERLDGFWRRGVRIMSLTWNGSNRLADGVGGTEHGGLSALGRRVLQRMQRLGMVVDVSHLSEAAFWQVLEATRGPIVATHSNAAAVHPHRRNLTNDQLRAIGRRGGVVGVNFYPEFLGGDTVEHVLHHVDHMLRVMGPDHVALGTDYDGIGRTPRGLEDVSRMPHLTEAMIRRGYAPEVVRKILGENALRVFRQVWGR